MLQVSIHFISSVSPFCPCTFLRFAKLDKFKSLWKWPSIPFGEGVGEGRDFLSGAGGRDAGLGVGGSGTS